LTSGWGQRVTTVKKGTGVRRKGSKISKIQRHVKGKATIQRLKSSAQSVFVWGEGKGPQQTMEAG